MALAHFSCVYLNETKWIGDEKHVEWDIILLRRIW